MLKHIKNRLVIFINSGGLSVTENKILQRIIDAWPAASWGNTWPVATTEHFGPEIPIDGDTFTYDADIALVLTNMRTLVAEMEAILVRLGMINAPEQPEPSYTDPAMITAVNTAGMNRVERRLAQDLMNSAPTGWMGTMPGATLTANNTDTIDGTWGAEEAAALSNLVTRLAELEVIFKAYGLIVDA